MYHISTRMARARIGLLDLICRLDTEVEVECYRHGGMLHFCLREALESSLLRVLEPTDILRYCDSFPIPHSPVTFSAKSVDFTGVLGLCSP